MADASATRRQFNHHSLVSLLAAIALPSGSGASAQSGPSATASSRRLVIKQRLSGSPERQMPLVEVVYPPGKGSPPHMHANGVLAFVVYGSVASKVGDGTERIFARAKHGGNSGRNPSHLAQRAFLRRGALITIHIAPAEAGETDLMRPI